MGVWVCSRARAPACTVVACVVAENRNVHRSSFCWSHDMSVFQVWFQNARAKYRRNLLKQQQDSDKPGQGAATSPSGADNKDGQKEGSGSITDLSNTRSPALSDISSTPSLSDLHSSAMDSGGDQSSSSITELFSSTIASIN